MKTIAGIILGVIVNALLLHRFWRNVKKDKGEYITINGIAAFGNSKKQYKIYKNSWTLYCDGKAYKLDIDNVIISAMGVPHKYSKQNGLQIDDAQVNKDYDSGVDRFSRARGLNKL